MSKVTIIQEFCPYEDRGEMLQCLKSRDYHGVLWDVDQKIRSKLKHSEDKWLECEGAQNFLEEIRSEIHESGVFLDE